MKEEKQVVRVIAMVAIAAVAVAMAGTGVWFVARGRRKTRFSRMAARARRVLKRDVAHLGRRVRSRVDHMPSHG